jgi:hypothetical protein
MAQDGKTKRQVRPQPLGDKQRFPNGKYQTPSSFQVRRRVEVLGKDGQMEAKEVVETIQHLPDVHPEMRGQPPIVLISYAGE